MEALGVPHPEIDLIVVNGESVGFDYKLEDGDQVEVYPPAAGPAIGAPRVVLRDTPSRPDFVADVNLGKLARRLRMCGFDTAYRNDFRDIDVVTIAVAEQRVVLTRDRRLLHHKVLVHGYWVRATQPDVQLQEVLGRFNLLDAVRPFHRCIECNGAIHAADKEAVAERLWPMTRAHYDRFYRCVDCGKVYWRGPHYRQMRSRIGALLQGKN